MAPTEVEMKSMPGYTGKLNTLIEQQIATAEKAIGIQNLKDQFPHLSQSSWRPAYPTTKDCNPAQYIDHTNLKPEATTAEVSKLCSEAKDNHFYAVCVNGCRARQCLESLRGTGVKVACVIGFPLGAGTTVAKAAEAKELTQMGVDEIDMVISVGHLIEGAIRTVFEDIKAVVEASRPGTVKVIFETCLLTLEEIVMASVLSVAAGAAFVKTSTGFSKGGATPEAIDAMLATVGTQCLVKASGGVRDFHTAAAYISVGVSRVGTSSGIAIQAGCAKW